MIILDTEESIKEIDDMLSDPSNYINPSGEPVSSLDDDVVGYVLNTIT